MKKMTRRSFIKTAAAGTIGLSLPSAPAFSKNSETIRIGYLPITDATPLLIAHANGYFEDEGLKAEKPVKIRGWSSLSESFLSGKFNLTHLLLPIPVWMRYNIKAPVKVLAWDHTNGSAVTVRGGIEKFEDLGGKNIAVPYWYSMHNIILQMGLKKFGLKPVIRSHSDKPAPDEVNLMILPPPEMPLALAGKKIDGYIVAEPFNAIGEVKTGAKILRFTGDIWKNHPCCVVVMKETLTSSNPVLAQKTINAVVRAQLWAMQNPDKTAMIMSREGNGYLPVPYEILKRVFGKYDQDTYGKGAVPQAIKHPEWGVSRIGFQPYPYPSATRFIIDQMRNTVMEGDTMFIKRLNLDFATKDLVDDSFVKKAIENAGGHGLFKSADITKPWTREEVIEI